MRARLIRSLLVVALVTAAAFPVEAQLGGLMRRAKEAAEKKAGEKDPRAAEPAASTRNPFADPAIVFISQDQLARFEKGLQYEIDQRNALRKSLASAGKSQEEYQACSQGAMTSPEMMKMIQDMADSSANASTEQMIKAQQKMYADMQATITKQCGPDPKQSQGARFERLRQIENEASDVAMPPGYTPPAGSQGRAGERPADYAAFLTGAQASPRANVAFSYRARPFFPSLEARARAQAAKSYPFARAYGMLKERIPVFCGKDKKVSAPTTITVGTEKITIVKVQQGGMEYVYRQDEVDALNAGCARVMGLMNALFDIDIQ
jgi:hypothetical protein